ncbi:MOSC domain-containing protein [Streptomyces coeruleorubidus]|uniref:MOSC domain-containing protein n=1 Tax=Streptomyces coeruleorubidus TaxID=116188 RepID=A0A5J6IDL8_STRC4|nr:MOSC N-terminal beta barrel domain-containing protein [Streptomyces coeruleorubidus]QEV28663.1 MOSC domain-containing protein [Streptomyces coeruleorubidus]GGT57695.1 molybdenum cofactor sulfurase [Streptomyces coeruleorubidus]
MARVVELLYYPVKGCAGISAAQAPLTPAGLAHDRSFMVVSDEGVYRTQRRDPRLAVIRPAVTADGERLTLSAPGTEDLHLRVDTTGARQKVDLFGTAYQGIDQGDTAADWLSEVLRARSRLVRVPPEHDRVTDGMTPGTSGYADSCALHVVSRSTLELLNRKLGERGASPLPVNRFRPNIVLDGWAEPHAEDRARRIRIGDTELGYAKLAIRCAVTLVEQESGARAGPEPLRTLAGYRRASEGGIAFGAKFAVLRPGRVSVGDEAVVTAWGESEL